MEDDLELVEDDALVDHVREDVASLRQLARRVKDQGGAMRSGMDEELERKMRDSAEAHKQELHAYQAKLERQLHEMRCLDESRFFFAAFVEAWLSCAALVLWLACRGAFWLSSALLFGLMKGVIERVVLAVRKVPRRSS